MQKYIPVVVMRSKYSQGQVTELELFKAIEEAVNAKHMSGEARGEEEGLHDNAIDGLNNVFDCAKNFVIN